MGRRLGGSIIVVLSLSRTDGLICGVWICL